MQLQWLAEPVHIILHLLAAVFPAFFFGGCPCCAVSCSACSNDIPSTLIVTFVTNLAGTTNCDEVVGKTVTMTYDSGNDWWEGVSEDISGGCDFKIRSRFDCDGQGSIGNTRIYNAVEETDSTDTKCSAPGWGYVVSGTATCDPLFVECCNVGMGSCPGVGTSCCAGGGYYSIEVSE